MFALFLLLYRNKEQWAFKFKYPGQVTPTAWKRPSWDVKRHFPTLCLLYRSAYSKTIQCSWTRSSNSQSVGSVQVYFLFWLQEHQYASCNKFSYDY